MSAQNPPILNYRETKAADALLPQPSVLSSRGWSQLHLEVFQRYWVEAISIKPPEFFV